MGQRIFDTYSGLGGAGKAAVNRAHFKRFARANTRVQHPRQRLDCVCFSTALADAGVP